MTDHSPKFETGDAPAKAPARFRAKLLLFPKFQLALVGANLGVMLLVIGATWLQMSRVFSDLAPAAGLSGIEQETYAKYLAFQQSSFHWSMGFGLLLGVAGTIGLTLLISHRFSGPLVNLRNHFKRIAEGAVAPAPRLRFRRGDFLEDLPPLVNEALDRIEARAAADAATVAATARGLRKAG